MIGGKKFFGLDMPNIQKVEEYDVWFLILDGKEFKACTERVAKIDQEYYAAQGIILTIEKIHRVVYQDVNLY